MARAEKEDRLTLGEVVMITRGGYCVVLCLSVLVSGFSDLMEGGWIPATSRIQSWEVWGKAVPRQ